MLLCHEAVACIAFRGRLGHVASERRGSRASGIVMQESTLVACPTMAYLHGQRLDSARCQESTRVASRMWESRSNNRKPRSNAQELGANMNHLRHARDSGRGVK